MQSNQWPKMLVISLLIGCTIFAGCTSSARAERGARDPATELAKRLESVDHVSFYFLSRTERYSITESRLKEEANLKIYRRCGGNCASYMGAIVEHLSQSTSVKCLDGQQDVLVEIGDETTVVYSHSGRMARFEGECYFNESGIRNTIKRPEFLFN